jgi:hypothetical protein
VPAAPPQQWPPHPQPVEQGGAAPVPPPVYGQNGPVPTSGPGVYQGVAPAPGPGVYQGGMAPASGAPVYQGGMAPASGAPVYQGGMAPASGAPAFTGQAPGPQHPVSWTGDNDPVDNNRWQPRIVPSPRPRRRGVIIALVAALVLAPILAGAAGFYLGTQREPEKTEPVASKSDPALSPYEANQVEVNKRKLNGEFEQLAQPWLPWVGACADNDDVGGPKLANDEARRAYCRHSGLTLHFVVYKSTTERDLARVKRQEQNAKAGEFQLGLQTPGRAKGGVTKADGNYVEYAFRTGDGRTICGIWWDRDQTATLLIESHCEEDLGGNFGAMRDAWRRHS